MRPLGALTLGLLAAAAAAQSSDDGALQSSLDAYVASLTTGSAYRALYTGLPRYLPFNIGDLAQDAPGVQSAETMLPTALQSFLNSVISVEQVIARTTIGTSEFASRVASQSAAFASINAYLSTATTGSAFQAVQTQLPQEILALLPLLVQFAPVISDADGGWSEEAKSVFNSIISEEQKIAHLTVSTVVVQHQDLRFSSTTVTSGTFVYPPATATAMATTTSGATAAGAAPTMTASGSMEPTSSTSTAAAPTHAWACPAMAGAGLAVAVGMVAL